ncbi:potassium transporter Kup [Zhouia sp. PK063]|uniref:potassium transporter Kup n=1 Tax=Zhouia sp. PK063 TaxID=3373602 RepID=UPI0037B493C7
MQEKSNNKSPVLILAALGVVYGDIGTSPLYALKECFNGANATTLNPTNIYGILSLIFWSLIIIITIKYLLFIMRADNQGEGGILALMQLVLPKNQKKKGKKRFTFIFIIGLFGAALLYGDGVLTPAISVISAVEGLKIATPAFQDYVVPITIIILLFLFWLQSKGTASVGKLFGPIMLVWFSILGILGVYQILQTPEILKALNPNYGFQFILHHGRQTLFVLGAIFLAVTGGEALYADMGHFGISPIRKAWFFVVLPGLVLNYFGQGALLLQHPNLVDNPFYHTAPDWALYPLIIVAMMATIIASQAVISGAFSLTFQAIQLNYLPRLRIFHTSEEHQGQVYLPEVNIVLLIATIAVVLLFKSSSNLAVAYGIAITVTMVITDILAFFVMHKLWKWSIWIVLPVTLFFLIIDGAFLIANGLKFVQGGWFPIMIAAAIFVCFYIWISRLQLIRKRFKKYDTNLSEFTSNFNRNDYANVSGTAVYMTSAILSTPMALQHNLKHNKVIHENVIILEIGLKNHPRVPIKDRMVVDDLGNGFYRVLVKYGYLEEITIPYILSLWRDHDILKNYTKELTFYLARQTILVERGNPLNKFADHLFIVMKTNSLDPTRYFKIPTDKVFEIGIQLEI